MTLLSKTSKGNGLLYHAIFIHGFSLAIYDKINKFKNRTK